MPDDADNVSGMVPRPGCRTNWFTDSLMDKPHPGQSRAPAGAALLARWCIAIADGRKPHHGQIKAAHVPSCTIMGTAAPARTVWAGGQRMKGTPMGKMIDCRRDYMERAIEALYAYRVEYMAYAEQIIKGNGRHYPQWRHVSISNALPIGTVCEADADGSDSPGADGAPAASSDDDDGGDPDPEPARPRSCNTPPPAIAPHPHGTRRNATATAGDSLPPPPDPVAELWRLPLVLAHIPISRSSWFAGVKAGRYPQPVRLSDRRVAWRASDIRSFVAAL